MRLISAIVYRDSSQKYGCQLPPFTETRLKNEVTHGHRLQKRVSQIRLLIATVYRNAAQK